MNDQNINEWNEAYNSHLIPMYGSKLKTSEERAADKKYVGFVLDYFKNDTTKACRNAARDGWHYFFKGVIDTAMFRFNQSWLVDSTYAASYFGFAAIKEYQGLNREAEKYYRLGYSHDPSDSLAKEYLHEIAQIKESQKDTAGLIRSYYKVLSHFPKDAIAAGKLGFFYSTIHKPDSALKYYNRTIALNPDYEQTYINRANLYCARGKFVEAIEDCNTVIKNNSKSIYGFGNRANALILNKQYNLALKDLDVCIALDPAHPNFHLAKADCYHELKNDKRACEEISKGIQKGGDYTNKLREYGCK